MRRIRFSDEAGYVRRGELVDSTIEAGDCTYDLDVVDVLPPTTATKILGIGANNPTFIEESDKYDWPEEFSDHPMYVKPPNCLVAHGDTAVLPAVGDVIFELEFGVVVGQQCRNVARADAIDVVKGFTCYNDITDRSGSEWLEIKAFDCSAPVGPVVASPDEVPDDAEMTLRVNGEVRQRGRRSEYIHTVEDVVSNFSSHRTLEPGDVLSLGTASGGLDSLADGDDVELEIEGIGTLAHDVTFA
jgi:2-keto-4-pentenoate hydratase/2-oxohepta-3-ene-1,7-dioic acid hydratase in catechol pathway